MTKQPEALRLADLLCKDGHECCDFQAADELRRLHDSNVELLAALQLMVREFDSGDVNDGEYSAITKARATIANATKEKSHDH
jgi:hypothetical protein